MLAQGVGPLKSSCQVVKITKCTRAKWLCDVTLETCRLMALCPLRLASTHHSEFLTCVRKSHWVQSIFGHALSQERHNPLNNCVGYGSDAFSNVSAIPAAQTHTDIS
jgi:hypothetical protein